MSEPGCVRMGKDFKDGWRVFWQVYDPPASRCACRVPLLLTQKGEGWRWDAPFVLRTFRPHSGGTLPPVRPVHPHLSPLPSRERGIFCSAAPGIPRSLRLRLLAPLSLSRNGRSCVAVPRLGRRGFQLKRSPQEPSVRLMGTVSPSRSTSITISSPGEVLSMM